MIPQLAALLPERWRVAVAIDRAARQLGWHVRFRHVSEDQVVVVYRRGLAPQPQPRRGLEDSA